MHLKKIKKLLKKINNLHQSFLDDDTISNIERDLFLSYVKELYEAGLDDQDEIVKVVDSNPLPFESKTKKVKTKAKSAKSKKATPRVKEVVTSSSVLESESTKEILEVLASTNKIVAETPVLVKEKLVPIVPKKVVEVIPEIIEDTSKDQFDLDLKPLDSDVIPVEMEGLFEAIEVKELSAKLANAPIKNIKSKLSINEKILTIAELFNGEQEHFNQAIDTLDGFSDFEQAKSYLAAEVVNKFTWLNAEKYKKAIRFVQLIQRRYL